MFSNIRNLNVSLSSNDSSSNLQDEPDHTPVKLLIPVVVASFLFLVIVGIISYFALYSFAGKKENEVNVGMGIQSRLNYLKEQQENLESYKKNEDGSYQIPIAEAMKKVTQ